MNYIRTFSLVGFLCAAAMANQSSRAQVASNSDTASSSSPAAYVYVSFTPKNSSVNEGTLIAAPDSGSTVRRPSCARTTPAPRKPAEAKA